MISCIKLDDKWNTQKFSNELSCSTIYDNQTKTKKKWQVKFTKQIYTK